jgi:hypothetical protein
VSTFLSHMPTEGAVNFVKPITAIGIERQKFRSL